MAAISPMGFNFGNTKTSTKLLKSSKSSKKREFVNEDDTKMSIPDDEHENRPVRSLKKVKSTINNHTPDEPDLGVLLASLPHQSLLSIMNNIINQEPSVKSLILSKIPQPSLSTYLHALNDSTNRIIHSIPLGNTRAIYTLSRLKIPLTDWSKVISTYLPFFTSSNLHPADRFIAIQPTTLQFIRLLSHLPTITDDQLPTSLDYIWQKIRQSWSDWFNQIDDNVNNQGAMFSASILQTWAKGLDEICQSDKTPEGFHASCQIDLINLRQNWESNLGWLIARDITARPSWAV
ncbi:hypothetical protein E3Q23_01071 [Wallemia mellicola]|nr:hypothetical protein E3Q23_01071 [Wallemia mellicola]TIB93130.1 hypothetical protein E3Q19_01435 [Wallemia mellicola]TIC29557.1 hypothetical protein E3Q11_01348 [Wallemia mellicola]TIC57941.1 hypothetical protein E3Q05_00986 [Wallemia mellicola]TIC75127.1 hypothetical protein E3Q00_01222 [Wallemia mellicola]